MLVLAVLENSDDFNARPLREAIMPRAWCAPALAS